jgi:hypothetical protein
MQEKMAVAISSVDPPPEKVLDFPDDICYV